MATPDRDPTPGPESSVTSLLNALGAQVRVLRKQRGLTLERLSELSGLSTGIVSQVEHRMAKSFVRHLGSAGARVGHLGGQTVARPGRGPVAGGPQGRASTPRRARRRGRTRRPYELLTPDLQGALEMLWLETPPGHDTSAAPFTHNGEEAGVVLSGSLDVFLDGVRHHLDAGDSIRYSSTLSHWYRNVGDEPCTAIWVITPPSW